MITVIPKCKVTYDIQNKPPMVIYISDHHATNVLRKIAEITFEFDTLLRSIQIQREEPKPAPVFSTPEGLG